jgi:hypothetical protein
MGDLAPHLHRGASQLAKMVRWNVAAGNLEEVAIGSWIETKRWSCRGDLNRFMIVSRRRID